MGPGFRLGFKFEGLGCVEFSATVGVYPKHALGTLGIWRISGCLVDSVANIWHGPCKWENEGFPV